MAREQTGKWVARAAATGGGSTYRGQRPVNWYASLVLICIVGIGLIFYSRWEKTHNTASSSGPPTTSMVWHAGLGIDICGTTEPNFSATPATTKSGFTTDGTGVIKISPNNSTETGANAVFGKFASTVKGFKLTESSIRLPGKPTYTNGDKCPKGTPDAGKKGYLTVSNYPNFTVKKPKLVQGDPNKLLFTDGQLIQISFLPINQTPPHVPATVEQKLISVVENTSSTNTSTPVSLPPTTATTAAPTATTKPSTTATTKP